MKRLLVGVALLPLIGHQAFAAACTSGSLAGYLAPGFSCTLGTDLTVSNFAYAPDGNGGTPAASNVSVAPNPGGGLNQGGVGITFSGLWSAPSPGAVADSSLTFNAASTDGSNIASTGLTIAASATGSGAFGSVNETVGGQTVVASTAGSLSAMASTSGTSLDVAKDIEAFAGSGSADLSSVTEDFMGSSVTPAPPAPVAAAPAPTPSAPAPAPTSVPEPETLPILALGLAVLGLVRGLRRNADVS